MPHLNRDGVSLYYEVHGEGPTLLLTHGYSASSQMWRGQVEALSARHQLIIWDMRGHGQSDYPDDPAAHSEAATVADMAALLDQVGAERAIVGGLSLGGYMSLAFHRDHRERVRALLIIDTGPGYRNETAREGWNQYALKAAERWEREGLSRIDQASPEVRASPHRNAEGLAKAARGMLTQRDSSVIDSLPTISVPSLVLVGADDAQFITPTDYMAAKIPDSEKVVIPKAGHAANIDQPEAFNTTVASFLEQLEA